MPEIVWRFICCSDPNIDDEGRGGVLYKISLQHRHNEN